MIETQHKQAPWRWVGLVIAPWFVTMYAEFLSGAALTYSLKKYIDNPGWISTINSLNTWFNIVVGMGALYISDRVWTRFGRRRPFLIFSWLPIALLLLLLPLMANFLTLLTIVVLWQAINDIGATMETLQQEVIPPHQRGRAGGMFQICVQLAVLFNATVMIGRFDDVEYIGTVAISGEQVVFWFAALGLILIALFNLLFVKEHKTVWVEPSRQAFRQEFAGLEQRPLLVRPFAFLFRYFHGFVRDVFGEKELWPIYLLTFSMMLFTFGLGAIQPLLYTEQWGYSKQEMGTNIFIGGVVNIALMAVIGFFADKLDRIKMFIFGSASTLLLNTAYWVVVQFFIPGQRPELWQIIVMGEIIAVFSLISGAVGQPLVYDYIPRAKLGTATAGRSFIRSMTKLFAINGIGWFVVLYSKLFMPPGQYDYFSGYLFMSLGGIGGLFLILYFAHQVKTGAIKKVGLEGVQTSPQSSSAAATKTPSDTSTER
jgi:MFS family permease